MHLPRFNDIFFSEHLQRNSDPAHPGKGSNVDKDLQEHPTAGESVGMRSGQAYQENDSYHSSNLPDTMDQVEGLCIPTICPDQQGPQESPRGRVNNSPDSPGLGVPAMVSGPAVHAGGLSDSVTDPQRPPDRPIRPTPSISTVRPASTSRMDTIRQGYTTEGISTEAAQLLLSGWSKGTNTAYQSGWRKWVSWCMSREVDPISCPVHPFLDFLAGLFSEGLQYRSINTIRSAVSMTHKQVNGVPLGQHPLVSRLFKGMYNFRPPQP